MSQDEFPLVQWPCFAMGKVSSSGLRLCRERYPLLASLLPVGMFQGSSKEKPGVRRDFSGIQDIGEKEKKGLNSVSCSSSIAEQHLGFAEGLAL